MSKAVWSTSLSRRGLLLGGAGLMLAGCGFQPMYGPVSGGDGLSQDMRRELAAMDSELALQDVRTMREVVGGATQSHRAMAGLSMGSMQAMQITSVKLHKIQKKVRGEL